MPRLLLIATVVLALVPGFYALTADASPDAVYKAQTGAVLLLLILAIVLVASLITGGYLYLFGKVADRLAYRYLPLFIGWKFLRSQRVTRTIQTRLAERLHALGSLPRSRKLALTAATVALAGTSLWLDGEHGWNALADSVSPSAAPAPAPAG